MRDSLPPPPSIFMNITNLATEQESSVSAKIQGMSTCSLLINGRTGGEASPPWAWSGWTIPRSTDDNRRILERRIQLLPCQTKKIGSHKNIWNSNQPGAGIYDSPSPVLPLHQICTATHTIQCQQLKVPIMVMALLPKMGFNRICHGQ